MNVLTTFLMVVIPPPPPLPRIGIDAITACVNTVFNVQRPWTDAFILLLRSGNKILILSF